MLDAKHKSLLYLSDKRNLYVGRLEPLWSQIGAVSTLLVSLDKPLELIVPANGVSYRGRSFLIPVGLQVTLVTHDSVVALCHLDALGTDLAKLIPKMREALMIDGKVALYAGIRDEEDVIKCAYFVLKTRTSPQDAFAQLESWIGPADPGTCIVSDERVTKAISLIKENYAKNLSVAEIAEATCLSVPRLIQLFKQITGVSIRRFRLWYRMNVVSLKFASGIPLTDAAIAAGFADYAQFSRVYREISGAKPVDMKNWAEIRILSATETDAAA